MSKLFWERLAWIWVIAIPLAFGSGMTIPLNYNPANVTITGGTINGVTLGTPASSAGSFYEAGTWVPSVGGTATYGYREGYYYKIGGMLYAWGNFQITALGTGSASSITGMPICNAGTNGVPVTVWLLPTAPAAVSVIGQMSSTMSLYYKTTASTGATAGGMGDGSQVYVSYMCKK